MEANKSRFKLVLNEEEVKEDKNNESEIKVDMKRRLRKMKSYNPNIHSVIKINDDIFKLVEDIKFTGNYTTDNLGNYIKRESYYEKISSKNVSCKHSLKFSTKMNIFEYPKELIIENYFKDNQLDENNEYDVIKLSR